MEHVHTLPVDEDDPDAAAKRYDQSIGAAGNLALAVLGIGNNGHIAYNEPGSDADSRTRVVNLTQESIDQAAGYFGFAGAMGDQHDPVRFQQRAYANRHRFSVGTLAPSKYPAA